MAQRAAVRHPWSALYHVSGVLWPPQGGHTALRVGQLTLLHMQNSVVVFVKKSVFVAPMNNRVLIQTSKHCELLPYPKYPHCNQVTNLQANKICEYYCSLEYWYTTTGFTQHSLVFTSNRNLLHCRSQTSSTASYQGCVLKKANICLIICQIKV